MSLLMPGEFLLQFLSDWKRPVARPHISWLATMNYDLSSPNLSVEDAVELALDNPLWQQVDLRTEMVQAEQ